MAGGSQRDHLAPSLVLRKPPRIEQEARQTLDLWDQGWVWERLWSGALHSEIWVFQWRGPQDGGTHGTYTVTTSLLSHLPDGKTEAQSGKSLSK